MARLHLQVRSIRQRCFCGGLLFALDTRCRLNRLDKTHDDNDFDDQPRCHRFRVEISEVAVQATYKTRLRIVMGTGNLVTMIPNSTKIAHHPKCTIVNQNDAFECSLAILYVLGVTMRPWACAASTSLTHYGVDAALFRKVQITLTTIVRMPRLKRARALRSVYDGRTAPNCRAPSPLISSTGRLRIGVECLFTPSALRTLAKGSQAHDLPLKKK